MATELISVGEYLKTSYEPDAEYVDGAIEERNVGEYDHSTWQGAILFWFYPHEKEWGIRVMQSLRIQVSETRYRIADVVVIDRSLPVEQTLTHPPVAVFEILSSEDTVARLLVKLDDYELMGIRSVLVVDPKRERFYRYENGNLNICHEIEKLHGSDATVNWSEIRELSND